MSDEKPYGETYYAELNRLHEAKTRAAEEYTAQMLYLRMGGSYDRDTPRVTRERVAEAAAQTWMSAARDMEALNAAEYRKAQQVDECDGTRYPAVLP
jgi:hypothetical protein